MLLLHPPALLGLVAVFVPPLAYFVARRQPAEVAWGAMQFLRLTPDDRRRLRVEVGLALALRMGVIGLLVLFVARPAVRGTWLTRAEGRPPRTVVVLIDASASMAARYDRTTAAEFAKTRAGQVIEWMWP